MAKKTCARCRKEASEKVMTMVQVDRGLFHFYCAKCMAIIEEKLA